jgi:uncharacterized protein DUF1579
MTADETLESQEVGDTAEKPEYRPSGRSAEHESLAPFVGQWTTEGNAYDSPFGPAARVTAAESYEWLTGGLFLIHRLHGRLGGQPMACLEVLGYDAASGDYPVRSFYNDGTHNLWRARPGTDTWVFRGNWKSDGRLLEVRCTVTFREEGRSRTAAWDYSADGARFKRFWDTRSVKG